MDGFYMAELTEVAEQASSIASQIEKIAWQYEPIAQAVKEFGEQSSSLGRIAQEVAEHSSSLRRISEEFERDYEPIRREAALAARELRDAQSVFDHAGIANLGKLQAITEQIGPLVKDIGAGAIHSAFLDLGLRRAELDLGFASIRPILDGLAETGLSEAMSKAMAMPRLEPAFLAGLPGLAVAGAGQVAVPREAPARRAGHLQRIGALSCGQVYAMLFILALFALMPDLLDDAEKAVFVITVLGVILRNGER